ncbi:MAG: glycosyltransferase family 4 protein [Colwellia sp.]|jgi:Glycosyltransferase
MKILVLSFYYQPDLCAGSFRCSAMIQSLIPKLSAGDEIEIITTLPNRYDSYQSEAPEYESDGTISVHRVKLPPHQSGMIDQSKAFIAYARQVLSLVKENQYDLVFATSSRLMTAALGAYVAHKKSTHLYLDIRDIFVDTINDVLPKKLSLLAKPVFSLLERWTINKANKVNLVSQGFQDYFSERYPEQKFSFFTNGIDSEFIGIQVASLDEVNERNDSISIVYAGNFGEGQGLHNIIPTLAKKLGGRVHIQLIGDGGRRSKLEEELKALDCKNVTLVPPVRRDELLLKYQEADVLFLHLNDYDAFRKVLPSKVFEYAALGKPILAGVSGYAAQFIKKEISNSEVFSPCNAEEAECALNLLELKTVPRNDFVDVYSRSKIMHEMTKDILKLVK